MKKYTNWKKIEPSNYRRSSFGRPLLPAWSNLIYERLLHKEDLHLVLTLRTSWLLLLSHQSWAIPALFFQKNYQLLLVLLSFFLFSDFILCIIQLTLYYVCIIIQLIIYLYIAQLCHSTNFQFNLFMYYSSLLRSSRLRNAQHLFFLTKRPPEAISFIFSVPKHFYMVYECIKNRNDVILRLGVY